MTPDQLTLPLEALEEDAPSAIELGMAALALTAGKAEHAEMLEALTPLAKRLALEQRHGITISDIRTQAVTLGFLTGLEKERELSYLGALCRRAGLVNTGVKRRSFLRSTHGIPQTVWIHPIYQDYRED